MREARSLGVIVVLLIAVLSAHAQTQTTGAISGIVQDATGAVLPGVEVKAGQAGTGETRSTVTSETGAYILPLLSPGKYAVSFVLPGFQTLINRDVVVNATEKVTLNGRLQVGDLSTSIDVAATAELIQAQTTTLGRVIDERLTTSLPLPTKNYTQLLTLSTGTAAAISDTAQLGRGSINISANGAPTDSNTFLLDGVDANNIHTNQASNNNLGSNGVPVPSTEMLREFKVQSGQYDAQYGRNGGASINVVTKSGTNDIHFVLFEYFRNDVLNANNFFFNSTGTHRPILRQNQFGATVGGPIRHDKTFFFLGYQGTRQLNGASLSNSSTSLVLPPIPEVRTPETLGQVFAGQSGRNGGVAIARDGSNINPVALAFLNRRWPNGQYVIPSPQRTGPGVNFTASTPARYTENQFTLNVDHELSTNHKVSLRFFGANVPQILAYGQNLGLPGFTTYNDFKNRNASITDTYTISPKTVNEARIGYSRPAGQSSATQSVNAADVGLNRYNLDRFPQIPNITVSGVMAIGHNANTDQATIPNTFVYQDTLSLTRGSHFIRAGGEARRMQAIILTTTNFRESFHFCLSPIFSWDCRAGLREMERRSATSRV